MKKPLFGYVMTAMITPFDDDNRVNISVVKKVVEHLLANGTDTFVVAGTTGESPTLSFNEKVQLFATVREAVAGRAKVIAGTGCNDTKKTISLTQAAEEAGVDGAMVVVPYYNKPPQNALYEHYKAVANETDLSIMIYNVPGRTSRNIEPKTVASLANIKNIVAIKEASGNLDQVTELVRLCGNKIDIYSGDDSLTLPMLSIGAVGVVSVASHIVGSMLKEMILAYHNNDVNRARELHVKLFQAFKGLFFTTNPVPVKTAMRLLGFVVGNMRLPLVNATPDEELVIKNMLNLYELLQ